MVPLRVKALAAASGLWKSMKQYPALLLEISTHWQTVRGPGTTGLPRKFVTDHLHIDLLAHVVPYSSHEVLVDPGLKLAHPIPLSAIIARTEWYRCLLKISDKSVIELSHRPLPLKPECKRGASYHKVVFASPPCGCPPADPGSPPLPPWKPPAELGGICPPMFWSCCWGPPGPAPPSPCWPCWGKLS